MAIILFCITMFFTLGIILFTRFLLIIGTVVSSSMSPTLEIGDRVLAVRYWPSGWLCKGQIVLFRPMTNGSSAQIKTFNDIPVIKRIIGLPGDKVHSLPFWASENRNTDKLVPPGHFFVRGDLPVPGNDSFSFGAIPFENFYALVVMKLPRRKNDRFVSENEQDS